jgi:hypothetical protein
VSSLSLCFVSLKFSKTMSLTQNNLHPLIFLKTEALKPDSVVNTGVKKRAVNNR